MHNIYRNLLDMNIFKIFVGCVLRTTMVRFETRYATNAVHNNTLESLAVASVYTTPCHCEAQFKMQLRSNQLSIASSPKQSFCSKFAAKSEQRDCFVTSFDCVPTIPLQSSANTNFAWIFSGHVPRNDESKGNLGLHQIKLRCLG
jgi:hypothetical protein